MTKSELAKIVSDATGYDVDAVKGVISATNAAIMKSLVRGEPVYMRGFGSFVPKARKQKSARNIKAATTVIIPEHTIAVFKPAPDFKEKMFNSNE